MCAHLENWVGFTYPGGCFQKVIYGSYINLINYNIYYMVLNCRVIGYTNTIWLVWL